MIAEVRAVREELLSAGFGVRQSSGALGSARAIDSARGLAHSKTLAQRATTTRFVKSVAGARGRPSRPSKDIACGLSTRVSRVASQFSLWTVCV
jgi:hypothetical protein